MQARTPALMARRCQTPTAGNSWKQLTDRALVDRDVSRESDAVSQTLLCHGWHQDGQYWPIQPLATITAWIAIDAVDTGNGCLRVIPGSHTDKALLDHDQNDSPDLILIVVVDRGHHLADTKRSLLRADLWCLTHG